MRKANILILMIVAVLLVLTVAFFSDALGVNAQQGGFKAHPLINAPKSEVEQAALQYTQGRFHVLSVSVTFPLTRRVTREELAKLGIDVIDLAGQPPLMLIVLKGDFIVTLRSPLVGNTSGRVSSIIYVFDLRIGVPTYTAFVKDEEVDRIISAAVALPEAAMPTTIQPLNTTPAPTAFPPTPAPTATPGLPTNSWNQSYTLLAQPLQTKEQALDQILYYDSKMAVWDQPWSKETLTTEPGRIAIEWHSDRSYDGSYYGPGTETGPVWVVTIKGRVRAHLLGIGVDPNAVYEFITYTIAQMTGDLLGVSTGPRNGR